MEEHITQLLIVHRVSDVRQIGMYTAEPLVPDCSPFEVELAIAKLKKCNSPGSVQIPAELFQAGCETLLASLRKLANSIWNNE
jgi:hypothetical protein